MSMAGWLAAVDTGFIVLSGAFLAFGYSAIRRRRVQAHHRSMIAAAVFAVLFLVLYVARWAFFGSKPFDGPPLVQTVYLAILIPHIILSIAVAPMAIFTLRHAFAGRFAQHRRLARITLPTWAFVAVSGWVIYAMLYLIRWS